MLRRARRDEVNDLSDTELDARNRIILSMIFEMLQTTHQTYLGGPERFGRDLDLLFVGLAIYLGDRYGRPMTVHKLAEFLGMPRAAVSRKIDELKRRGIVQDTPEPHDDNAVEIVPEVLKSEPARQRKRRWLRSFFAAAEQLDR